MIEFGGIIYHLDMDALDKTIARKGVKPTDKLTVTERKQVVDAAGNTINEIHETTTLRGAEIDGAKYEIIRMMIETILDYNDEGDTSLGAERALSNTPLKYKIAFNTLYNYGILKEKE